MATTKKTKAAAKARALEDMTPSEIVASEIIGQYPDLAPSVTRIMQAELDEAQRHRAISSFKASLTGVGDPNRDPRYAIANCGLPD